MPELKDQLPPPVDAGLSTLLEDLNQRGLLETRSSRSRVNFAGRRSLARPMAVSTGPPQGQLGIDVNSTRFIDPAGGPQYVRQHPSAASLRSAATKSGCEQVEERRESRWQFERSLGVQTTFQDSRHETVSAPLVVGNQGDVVGI